MSALLSEEEIEQCKIQGQWLSENATVDATDAMLQAAARLGMRKAADQQTGVMSQHSHESDDFHRGIIAMYDAIRAAAE